MSNEGRTDVARQVANVLGAIFQVVAPALAGPAIGRVSAENPTFVVPGDYAFVIWTPIFFLALVYAVYQALPANRENPLLMKDRLVLRPGLLLQRDLGTPVPRARVCALAGSVRRYLYGRRRRVRAGTACNWPGQPS